MKILVAADGSAFTKRMLAYHLPKELTQVKHGIEVRLAK